MNVNKNSHTTSTKCQYQADASNPKKCSEEIIIFLIRFIEINRKIVPIITWMPWKPVVKKNVDPKTPSEMENWAW